MIVFDVNETLLDLDTMTPIFERIFHEKLAMRLWFANLILYSEALTLAKLYVPFTDIGGAVLQMLADTRGIRIMAADKKELTEVASSSMAESSICSIIVSASTIPRSDVTNPYVEKQLRVTPSGLFLIASHTWDTLGAVAAGWGAALIKRPGNDVLSVGPQPTLVGANLDDVANQLIRRFSQATG
jgi:2-haloacid dehalogenase